AGQMKDAVCPGLLETDQRPGSSNQAGHSPGKNPRPTATNDGFYREENGSDKKHPFCISLLGENYNWAIMTMRCAKCGAEIPEGSPVCRSCFEPVKPEGFFSRL